MSRSRANLPERMKFRWAVRSKEPVPRVGAKAHDAREPPFQVAKLHGSQQRGEVPAERPHGGSIVQARVYCNDQEDRGAGERRAYWLRNGTQAASSFGRAHRIGLHLDIIVAGRAEFQSLKDPTAPANVVDKLTIVCR